MQFFLEGDHSHNQEVVGLIPVTYKKRYNFLGTTVGVGWISVKFGCANSCTVGDS